MKTIVAVAQCYHLSAAEVVSRRCTPAEHLILVIISQFTFIAVGLMSPAVAPTKVKSQNCCGIYSPITRAKIKNVSSVIEVKEIAH